MSDWKRFADATAVVKALKPSYPVMCVRPHVLARLAEEFLTGFPGKTLYALKCNPHPLVVRSLYRAGVRHFDAASLPEIAQVYDTCEDATAYFMHPVKPRAVIKTAHDVYGVNHFVVDDMGELHKVHEAAAAAEPLTIVVRIKTPPAPDTLYDLASKFGAERSEAIDLLRTAASLGHRVGIAFHVGSQCCNPFAYRDALRLSGEILHEAGVTPACIDVGGGFPASYTNQPAPPLEDFMAQIRAGLAELNLPADCEVLAEPGRALVALGCSLVVQVLLRKGDRLYVNDGIYGCLTEVAQGRIGLPVRLLRPDRPMSEEKRKFSLYGPTCDSLDVMPLAYELPADVDEGDWIEIGRLGAYSNSMTTQFNGFRTDTFVVVEDEALDAPHAIAAE